MHLGSAIQQPKIVHDKKHTTCFKVAKPEKNMPLSDLTLSSTGCYRAVPVN